VLVARQEIEYLRRLYAKATDLIGTSVAADVELGRQIYAQIFTPQVQIRTLGGSGAGYSASGPQSWADVVLDALGEYVATQHLIGTQLVELHELQHDDTGALTAGSASMESYLSAWHARAAGTVYVFICTYIDWVQFSVGQGWQIEDMSLVEVSTENRPLGNLPRPT